MNGPAGPDPALVDRAFGREHLIAVGCTLMVAPMMRGMGHGDDRS